MNLTEEPGRHANEAFVFDPHMTNHAAHATGHKAEA